MTDSSKSQATAAVALVEPAPAIDLDGTDRPAPPDLEPAKLFAAHLAELPANDRKTAIQAVEARVLFGDAEAENYACPKLLSSEEAAEQHALHVNHTRDAIVELGYEPQMHRLGGSSSNSTECREAVASYVRIQHGLESSYTERLIRQIVSGRGDGLLEALDS